MQQVPHGKQEPPQALLRAAEKHRFGKIPPSPCQQHWGLAAPWALCGPASVLTSSQKQMHTSGQSEWKQQCDNYMLISLTVLRQIARFML